MGLHRFGDPDVLEVVTLPLPTAGTGEVVVRVVAATVNPTDLLFRSGQQAAGLAAVEPPYIPGMELAGFVHELGDQVTGLRMGQPVMGIVDPRSPQGGAQAEYVALPAASVVPAGGRDLVEAATVPMNGLTAMMAIERLDASPGQVVLITGAAGAVGGYAVELAHLAGLTVVADVKDEDASLVRSLGADHLVPRGDGMVAAVRELFPGGSTH